MFVRPPPFFGLLPFGPPPFLGRWFFCAAAFFGGSVVFLCRRLFFGSVVFLGQAGKGAGAFLLGRRLFWAVAFLGLPPFLGRYTGRRLIFQRSGDAGDRIF